MALHAYDDAALIIPTPAAVFALDDMLHSCQWGVPRAQGVEILMQIMGINGAYGMQHIVMHTASTCASLVYDDVAPIVSTRVVQCFTRLMKSG